MGYDKTNFEEKNNFSLPETKSGLFFFLEIMSLYFDGSTVSCGMSLDYHNKYTSKPIVLIALFLCVTIYSISKMQESCFQWKSHPSNGNRNLFFWLVVTLLRGNPNKHNIQSRIAFIIFLLTKSSIGILFWEPKYNYNGMDIWVLMISPLS